MAISWTGWRCPQCAARAFSTAPRRRAIGPEHPQYIPFPQPPQQTGRERKFIKGRLPVPRDVFEGSRGRDKASDEWLEKHTQPPSRPRGATRGSREEWKQNLSDMRRRNLREGLTSLRARKTSNEEKLQGRYAHLARERDRLIHAPEREDEKFTKPSHGLNLQTLYHGPLQDPTRPERLAAKRANLAAHTLQKRNERLAALNTLYLNARSFIVTPAQLEAAVDKAFGTPEHPVTFGARSNLGPESSFYAPHTNNLSVWAYGRPENVQDMLNRANRQGSRNALDGARGYAEINRERIRRIAETLTGGKMVDGDEART